MPEQMRFAVSESSRFPPVIGMHHTKFINPRMDQIQHLSGEGTASVDFRKSPATSVISLDTYTAGHLNLVMPGQPIGSAIY
ncbi:hypothetical protein V6L77_13665 [Pannonibacter sp. Pt2-lr]|uniref:Uncharacterized protein n=1 Tax=Pannonibacter anstelovis TaxID=3121537 RepID=A0ABU7ZSG7_9HYPH